MAWNRNFTIFYDYEPTPELKCHFEKPPLPSMVNISSGRSTSSSHHHEHVHQVQERKRRLSMDQIETLERSFQEEIKLEPERKMRLAQELGLQPRQVAVWFQNRRARWKTKQLERVYGALKQEFDAISREKHKLQQEVMKLKAELHERAVTTKQGSTTGHTDATSAEETVESAVVVHNHSTCNNNNNNNIKLQGNSCQQMGECNYLLNIDDYDPSLPSYWGVLPSYS